VLHIVPSLDTGGREHSMLQLLKRIDSAAFEAAAVSLFPHAGRLLEHEAAEAGIRMFYLSKRVGLDLRVLASSGRSSQT
jgi:hypothetical protein